MQLGAAFTDWSTFRSEISFIGLDNFVELASTGELGAAIKVSIIFAVAVMVFENVFTLGLALALESTTRTNGVFRTLFFLPVLISAIAAGHAARAFFAAGGFVNNVLTMGVQVFGGEPISTQWLGNPDYTIYIVALIHAWKFGGVHLMIYLAGLTAIPKDLVDAATIDGASPWQIFRNVKFPLLAPAITINITLTLIGALSAFDIIFATTKGGPGRSTEIYNMVVMRQWGSGLLGYATAMSVLLVVSIIVVAVPLITFLRSREVEL